MSQSKKTKQKTIKASLTWLLVFLPVFSYIRASQIQVLTNKSKIMGDNILMVTELIVWCTSYIMTV